MGAVEFLEPSEVLWQTSLPAIHTPLDRLFSEYRRDKADIVRIGDYVNGDVQARVMHHFLTGANRDRRYASYTAKELFQVEPALLSLDCTYWQKAISLTDVYEVMPAKRRNEWAQMIRTGFLEEERGEVSAWRTPVKTKVRIPEFTDETVRNTLFELLNQRQQFFAERVDGVFRGLSAEHLTNQPQGFAKRMIVNYVINAHGHLNYDKANLLHDLRYIIARFMGRDDPPSNATNRALDLIVDDVMRAGGSGVWHNFDGGAFRVRMYKIGTAHLEVHPDIAYRLNGVLAHLHPQAIPSEFRQKPQKRAKSFQMVHDLVPFEVLGQIEEGRLSTDGKTWSFYNTCTPLAEATKRVLAFLGGVPQGMSQYCFEYSFYEVRRHLLRTGQLPEQKSHQYYPTPESIAQAAVALADLAPGLTKLEPSAGQGGIAEFLGTEQTTCVEISPLHCKVLEAKGFATIRHDFMTWQAGQLFDRIVMNPPFSEGRALEHLKKAASLLKPDGVLVAVLPASYRGKDLVDGMAHEWCGTYTGEFKGTGVSVSLLRLKRL